MENQEGKRIPEVTFRTRKNGDWHDLRAEDIFRNKKVVVFSLPGAFTPTCSSTHLPRYDELAPVLRNNGIDEIVCISVNDGFVMEAWSKDQNVRNIQLLPRWQWGI